MWFLIAVIAVAFVASIALMPKPKIENARAATLDQFNLPRSAEGDPVPLAKGTTKLLGPNTIGCFGFRSEAITKKVSTGLFSSKRQTTGYKYYIGLNLALCLGPNVRLRRIWAEEKEIWSGSQQNNPWNIRVFKDANYGSKMLSFSDDVPNLKDIGLNDGISSFQAFGTWDLFEDAYYMGASIRVTGDNPNLYGTPFQDRISSMRRVLDMPGNVITTGGGISTGRISIDAPNFGGGEEGNGGLAGNCTFYDGSMNQAQDAYLAANLHPKVPAYHGISHFVMEDFYVGNSPNIPALAFELQCFTNTLGMTNGHNIMPNGLDENPIETLHDLYVTFWGKLGFDASYIDTANFREAAETIWAENNGISLLVTTANGGGDLTREIIRQINAILYQDIETGRIRIKLIRADYNIDDLPVLRPSNVLEITNYSKQLWDETFNQVRIKYKNRANNYQDAAALWQDFANINMQQRVRSTDISMPGVYTPDLANVLAAREGSEINVPLLQCEFNANRTIAEKRPGDCFILDWPEYKIRNMVMRIRKFDTSELADGKIVVMCVQDEFSSKRVVFETPSASEWEAPNTDPDPIGDYTLFAAPYFFRSQISEDAGEYEALWALARKPDPQSQSYDFLTSLDGFNTSALSSEGTIYTGAGVMRSTFVLTRAADTGFDSTPTGIVVGDIDGNFVPVSQSDADIQAQGVNLIYCNGEFLSYRDVEPMDNGDYTLTNIHRALFDTNPVLMLPNANVYFITSADGVSDTQFTATAAPAAKLLDKAPGGRFREEAATILGPYSLDSRSFRPAPPRYVTYAGLRSGSASASATGVVAWRERNRKTKTVKFFDDATETPEAGQDNRVRWRIGSGSYTTVNVTGNTVNINTSAAVNGDILTVEVFSRRDGILSRVGTTATITLTVP